MEVALERRGLGWRNWIDRGSGLLMAGLFPVWLSAGPSVHDLEAQYRFSCAPCHGLDGSARGPAGQKLPGRVLADRAWLAKQKDEELLKSLLEGKGAMPSFKHKLPPEEALRLLKEIVRPLARRGRSAPRQAARPTENGS